MHFRKMIINEDHLKRNLIIIIKGQDLEITTKRADNIRDQDLEINIDMGTERGEGLDHRVILIEGTGIE